MSTTWTSLINETDSSVVDNSAIGTEDSGTIPGTGSGSGFNGMYFTGIMNSGQTFYFGTEMDYGISHNSADRSMDFDVFNTIGLVDSSVLFNFGDGNFKLYKGGPVAIKNLSYEPTPEDYDVGAMAIISGKLKIRET